MSKRFLICLIIFAGISIPAIWWLDQDKTSPFAPPITNEETYASATKLGLAPPPAQSAPKAIPWKQTIRLAIGSLGYPDEAQNRQFGDLITAQLSSSRGLELVERRELEAVLKEQELSLSGLVRARDAVRAGKLLRADWFLLGTISQVNGTNSLVVRLVDARSGIMCGGAVFTEKSTPALVAEVADFVHQTRQATAEATPRVYLAIGTFEDLSVNTRQAGFATQLRGYLTAAYQHGRFTLLEREYAQILYQEMELDLAGLTGGSATNMPAPIQPAFWLVDGYYQSYETTNSEVEVMLNVHRIFSTAQEATIRGLTGEPICREIKLAIDGFLEKPAGLVMPTRFSEARLQMKAAIRLGRLGPDRGDFISNLSAANSYEQQDEQEAAVQRYNMEEAIRALDTVLLLQPTNRAAKFDLAACYRNQNINRMAEARNLYREILEEPVQDDWATLSQYALVDSFEYSSPQEKARWFERALDSNTNSALEHFYRQNAETADRDAAIQSGEGDVTKLAEQRLLESIQSTKNMWDNKPGSDDGSFGLYNFTRAFHDNAVAARKMVEFLPTMKAKFPELAPHLTAAVLTFQTDTNSPIVVEFQKQLEWCQAHPKELYEAGRFWRYCGSDAFIWLYNHKLYQLALQTMKGWQEAATDQKIGIYDSNQEEKRVSLGYAYAKVGQWRPAMEIFDSFSNMPVYMNRDDWPWGRFRVPVLPDVEANYCRKKLSLPVVHDSREFEMDKIAICTGSSSYFAVDGNGLWIGNNDKLIHVNFNLETNVEISLPKDPSTPVTAICVSPSKLWVGTGGDGLIEFDKANHQCRRFTVQDGLMMNQISCARLSGNTLWIGYGYPEQSNSPGTRDVSHSDIGGLGFLNLSSHQFVSLTPSLANGMELPNQPPRQGVSTLAFESGDIWFLTEDSSFWHFQRASNTWDVANSARNIWCLATDAEGLYAGQFDFVLEKCKPGAPGLMTFNFRNGQWQSFKPIPPLPSNAITTITPDDGKIWVGGTGYIALIDPHHDRLCCFTRIWSPAVDHIEIGGGYMWAQYNGYLHRATLGSLQ
jgi:tetratricopeptide (TPR) repeat protein